MLGSALHLQRRHDEAEDCYRAALDVTRKTPYEAGYTNALAGWAASLKDRLDEEGLATLRRRVQDDLKQACVLGVCNAARLYDPAAGRFETFAALHMRAELTAMVRPLSLDQRHRDPHHVMRDLPGQRQQLVLHGLRQHLPHRHLEFRPDRPKPRPKISHAPHSSHPSRQPAAPDTQPPPGFSPKSYIC